MKDFIAGATAAGCLVIALFFLRYWRQTADRLFAAFALAFSLFGVNRLLLALLAEDNEARTYVYLVRLLAFLVIIGAIVEKNRPRRPT
jgi:membrane-associated PAP2 superfamily phosphatase